MKNKPSHTHKSRNTFSQYCKKNGRACIKFYKIYSSICSTKEKEKEIYSHRGKPKLFINLCVLCFGLQKFLGEL
jgi:hypothetical protein